MRNDTESLPSEKISETEIIYRLCNDPAYGSSLPSSEIMQAIDFEAADPINYAEAETLSGKKHIIYSKPADHKYLNNETKLIDLCVIGDSREEVESKVQELIEESNERKRISQEFVKENIIPYLQGSKFSIGVLGRGDIYDPERVSTSRSDIDIMLFVNFGSFNEGSKEALKEMLLKMNLNSKYGDLGLSWNFHSISSDSVSQEEVLARPEHPVGRLSIDVIPYNDVSKLISRFLELEPEKRRLAKYDLRAFTEGVVLMDSDDDKVRAMQEVIKMTFNR